MLLILFVGGLILGAWIIELIDCSMYNAAIGNDKYKHKCKKKKNSKK